MKDRRLISILKKMLSLDSPSMKSSSQVRLSFLKPPAAAASDQLRDSPTRLPPSSRGPGRQPEGEGPYLDPSSRTPLGLREKPFT